MKRLTESLPAKIAAIMLSFAAVAICAVSAVSAVVMVDAQFYTRTEESLKKEALEDLARSEMNIIAEEYGNGTDLNYYTETKNAYFTIKASYSGEMIFNNYNGEEYLAKETGKELSVYGQVLAYDENGYQYYENDQIATVDIEVYIAKDMMHTDKIKLVYDFIGFIYPLRYSVYIICAVSLVVAAVLLIFLYCAAGHRKDGTIQLNHLDKVPFDLLLAVALIVECVFIYLPSVSFRMWVFAVTVALFCIVSYFTALAVTLTFATRIKTGTLISNNLIYKLLRFIGRYLKKGWNALKYIFKNLSLIGKTVLIVAAVVFAEFVVFMFGYYSSAALFFWWFVFTAVISLAVLYTAVILQKIKKGGERIALGDLDFKIDTQYMYGDFKRFAESLNNINLGLQNAVNEKMKSERFKTELITNVSHDIKTPLTSIINYVDLIKKEQPENENIKQYIEVLDRQSGRLKKLIEDLVEASKASTGNLAVSLTECEVGVLLSQTIGEFDERLSKSGLTAVLKQPETPVRIMADGRHLWRVFDNLMSNICKYSQTGTRVYLDVSVKDGKAVITFRNISKYELNISSEELMERFVRGDSSRHTEGSGLGLSIARSLVELQNGQMKLDVDGDLFKVILTFDAV